MATYKLLDSPDLERAVKVLMGYHDPEQCCKACEFYVPCDCSGNYGALGEHCTRNVFGLNITAAGWCNYWTPKTKKPGS